jgi:hypothetical protein
MTTKLLKRFAEVGEQEFNENDPIIIAHFLHLAGPAEYFCISFDPERQSFQAFRQLWRIYEADEWVEVYLDEMERSTDKYGFHMIRDPFWVEKRASQAIDGFKGF